MESMSNSNERAFSFIPVNQRESKPRTRGITEIRGPYYTPMGKTICRIYSKPWGIMWTR